jgi:hypothetical protein
MGQAAPCVVKHAQEGCAFSFHSAMQAARREPSSSATCFGPKLPLAHGQGRNFLAYLLIMSLMHLHEEEDQGRPRATH